jgi:PTS system mannose-specific IIA component
MAMHKEPGFVIVTHGGFGRELLRVAEYIMGSRLGNIRAVRVPFQGELERNGVGPSPTPFADRQTMVRQAIAEAMRQVDSGGGVVVLTDIMGGTAFNCARNLLQSGKNGSCAMVAGVNLPMLLKIPSVLHLSAAEAAVELADRSRAAIVLYPGQEARDRSQETEAGAGGGRRGR